MSNVKTSITLFNDTDYAAQITVKKEEQIIAFMPSIEPGQKVIVPTTNTYEVIASTVIDGNTYFSAPFTVTGSTGFLAQVIQEYKQGTYVFDVQEVGSTSSSELQFQSTWRGTVNFSIQKDGKELQSVICSQGFLMTSITLGDTYSFQAVINGVTTDLFYTTNPNATCTAVNDTAARNSGFYTVLLK